MSAGRGLFLAVAGWVATTLVSAGLIVTGPDEAAAVKLNPALVAGGAVLEAQLTPDGSRVVYLADQEANERVELYSVPALGGTATKLNKPLVAGGSVQTFEITPDGSRVVYLASQDKSAVEIYSIPVTGGTAVKLNDPMIANVGGNVTSLQITRDGSRVVFLADQDTKDHFQLYSIPVGGGTRVKLDPDIVVTGSVVSYQISPDDSRVVYRGDTDKAGLIELFSVSILGGPIAKLNPTTLTGDVTGFAITPNSSQVVYRANQDSEEIAELYVVPIAGGTFTKLNGLLATGAQVGAFQITPDGSRVVFKARREISQPPPAEDIVIVEIYSVSIAGGPTTMTKLNKTLPVNGSLPDFLITPDGSRVVYRGDQDADTVNELYSVPVTGGAVTKLNPALVLNGDVLGDTSSTSLLQEGPQITPDGSRIVYRADQTTDGVNELFSVPVGGGAAIKLNPPLPSNRDVVAFQISPDGTRVVYLADQDNNGRNELYSVPVVGGPVTKVSQTLAVGRTIIGFQIGPDSRQVIYLDGAVPTNPPQADPVQELYSVQISSFVDVSPDNVLLPWIEALAESGIAGGCSANPPLFCPKVVLTRAQMAVLMVRGLDGPGVPPPPATGAVFVDVPASAFGAAYIERFKARNLTGGCQASPPRFCPDQGLTRAEMAVFLLRAKHGAAYQPPHATGIFSDVPLSHSLVDWVEQLAREGITSGCGVGRFCPGDPLTREQISVFLVRILGLPL